MRLELNTEQMRQTKDCRALTLSVGVNRIGLNFGFVLHDKVEDVVALPGTTSGEAREERDIHIRNQVVTDPAVTAIAEMVLG